MSFLLRSTYRPFPILCPPFGFASPALCSLSLELGDKPSNPYRDIDSGSHGCHILSPRQRLPVEALFKVN